MKKDFVLPLQVKCSEVAKTFSNPDRACNGNKEIFTVNKIIPMSESVAVCIFDKIPSGKKAIAVLYYVNGGDGYWSYFFPTYDHLSGFSRVEKQLHDIEVFNFDRN